MGDEILCVTHSKLDLKAHFIFLQEEYSNKLITESPFLRQKKIIWNIQNTCEFLWLIMIFKNRSHNPDVFHDWTITSSYLSQENNFVKYLVN